MHYINLYNSLGDNLSAMENYCLMTKTRSWLLNIANFQL